jgi:hypothetical protein
MKNIEDIKKFKIFIAGPMRGYLNYNFDKFDRIEKLLKDNGIDCLKLAITKDDCHSLI